MLLTPDTLTFRMFPSKRKPTLTIERRGKVRELRSFYEENHINVLVIQPRAGFHITSAQSRSMMQIIYAAMYTNPTVHITFEGGCSPWSFLSLHRGQGQMTLSDALQEKAVDVRKRYLLKMPKHQMLKDRRNQTATNC